MDLLFGAPKGTENIFNTSKEFGFNEYRFRFVIWRPKGDGKSYKLLLYKTTMNIVIRFVIWLPKGDRKLLIKYFMILIILERMFSPEGDGKYAFPPNGIFIFAR